jgi:aminobenzoyl-glutamate utilization protein B
LNTDDVVRSVDRHADMLVDMATRIWQKPELGLLEFAASRLQAEALRAEGFTVEQGIGGMATAFVATWGKGGPTVGMLGEFDALPALSQDAVAERRPVAEGQPGHGCGHNLLGTAALGAAIALKEALSAQGVPGTVKYFGCPAEESLNAKGFMIKAGAFEGTDLCFYFHPGPETAAGMSSCLATATATFTFHGVAAHAAHNPERGRSALDAVELMNVGVNYLREHVPPDVRIHYQVTNGGGAPNVVPDLAASLYFVRAATRPNVESAYARVVDCAEGAARMTGTRVEVRLTDGLWNILPSRAAAMALADAMDALGPVPFEAQDRAFAAALQASCDKEAVAEARARYRAFGERAPADDDPLVSRSLGLVGEGTYGFYSTDASDVSRVVPTGFLSVATAPIGTPGHSWQNVAAAGSRVGMKGMLYAARTMAAAGLAIIREPARLDTARSDFEAAMAENPYRLPVPELLPPPHVPADAPWRATQTVR